MYIGRHRFDIGDPEYFPFLEWMYDYDLFLKGMRSSHDTFLVRPCSLSIDHNASQMMAIPAEGSKLLLRRS